VVFNAVPPSVGVPRCFFFFFLFLYLLESPTKFAALRFGNKQLPDFSCTGIVLFGSRFRQLSPKSQP
jgi:hypothetical protein